MVVGGFAGREGGRSGPEKDSMTNGGEDEYGFAPQQVPVLWPGCCCPEEASRVRARDGQGRQAEQGGGLSLASFLLLSFLYGRLALRSPDFLAGPGSRCGRQCEGDVVRKGKSSGPESQGPQSRMIEGEGGYKRVSVRGKREGEEEAM